MGACEVYVLGIKNADYIEPIIGMLGIRRLLRYMIALWNRETIS